MLFNRARSTNRISFVHEQSVIFLQTLLNFLADNYSHIINFLRLFDLVSFSYQFKITIFSIQAMELFQFDRKNYLDQTGAKN
jgi:hypothetical protein